MNDFMELTGRQKLVYIAEIILFQAVWMWVGYQLMVVGGAK